MERWLDDTIQDPEVEFNNYACVRKDRNPNGVGVATYARSDLALSQTTHINCDDLGTMWINILPSKIKPIPLGTCHRSLAQSNLYYTMEEVYSKTEYFVNSAVIITGDVNTNAGMMGYMSWLNALKTSCSTLDLTQINKDLYLMFRKYINNVSLNMVLVITQLHIIPGSQ